MGSPIYLQDMKAVEIRTDYIKLNQFLKWANIAYSGAEANRMIHEGMVKVDGVAEQRRGRKLYPGNRVEVEGFGQYLVVKEGSAGIASKGTYP
jgi:ribosome-associated protein